MNINELDLTTTEIDINLGEPSIEIELPGGARGIKGDKGDTGPQGIQGPQGPQGIQGIQGPTGATGPAGPSNTLTIGTVQKGDNAEATITGDAPNQTLNLTLPKGDKGDTGAAGQDGTNGQDGSGIASITKTSTAGLVDTYTITYDNGNTDTFDVTNGADGDEGPEGPQGPEGPAGQDGQNGQDGVSPTITSNKVGKTTTLTITDAQGTSTATILDGDDGTNGQDGSDGVSPIITTSKTGKTTTLTIVDADGTKTATILDGADGQGSGDMLTSVYDTNHSGIVDNAEAVNGHTVGVDVPADAVFTDTTYTAGAGIDITSNVISAGNAKTWYGTSTTSASTAAKVATCSGFKLETGATIFIKFTNGNSYNGTATLDVNSTGAKEINYVADSNATRYYWKSGEVVGFVYDGSEYIMIEKAPASTTYYGITKLSSSTSSTSETLAATPKAVKSAYDLANGKQDALVSGTNIKTINSTSLLGSGDISVSTFSGSYNDLTDKPTIPTVNNATLTIQKNGSTVDTFTANASSNVTANITVPTKTSDITNDSGFITSSSNITGNAATSSKLKPVCAVGSDAANTNGWYKIASSTMSGWGNHNILYFVKAGFTGGYFGLLELEMRTDNTNISNKKCCWLTRSSTVDADSIIIAIDGMTWTMYAKNPSTRYGRLYFTEISNGGINGTVSPYAITYYDGNSTPEASQPTASVTSSDGGVVLRATQDKNGDDISTTYYKASNPNGYTSNTGTITSVKMNGSTIASSGEADLGTVLTSHQSIKTVDGISLVGSGNVEVNPVGSIKLFAGSTSPTGYLLCDGSAISRTTYSDLFTVIGTTYGTGDGSTTFNLPNLKGKVPVGLDANDTAFDTLGETGGEKTHTLTVDEMPKHKHEIPYVNQTQGTAYAGLKGATTLNWWSDSYMNPTGGDQPHNNLQPYITLNYIIKY